MEIYRTRALRGRNRWSHRTLIEVTIVCATQTYGAERVDGFERRLRDRFPAIGPLPQLGPAAAVPLGLEAAALALQVQAGCAVSFSRTTPTATPGIFQTVVEYTEEAVGELAVEQAELLCRAALDDVPFDLDGALRRLRQRHAELRMGPGTSVIVQAAVARDIPFRRLTRDKVQFGWGSRQRRIFGTILDSTSAVGRAIARDKGLTKKLLDAGGIPVPLGRGVIDADDAWAAALEIGLPVVVKPAESRQGRGITVNVSSREHLNVAFGLAREIADAIMVERHLPGNDYRLLVVGDKVVAAARRDPPRVLGDGRHTVRELVELADAERRRNTGDIGSPAGLCVDESVLACLTSQGYRADSVPPRGASLVLRNNADLSTGASITDVTADVHPEVAALAVEAAQTVGLDVCGVDLVCVSVEQPLDEQHGGIIAVNVAPDLRMYMTAVDQGQPIGDAIVSQLFADGADGRIPLVAVTGTNGKTTTVRLTAHLLAAGGLRIGMTNTDGVYIEGRRIDGGDCSGPRSAHKVLLHPEVDAAVCETARGGVLRAGLGFDRCTVAVLTNIGFGDHLDRHYITTVEDLAALKQVIVQSAGHSGMAVLNADDPLVAGMADACLGQVTFFGRRTNPVLAAHLARGGRTIYVEDARLVAAEGGLRRSVPLQAVPITYGGTVGFQIENAMAAVAAAWAVGIEWDAICHGLSTFINNADNTPGRFNIFRYRGATVIVDYGHNRDAMLALVRAVETMPSRRRVVVISGVPDRRDDDIRQQTSVLGAAFDDVLLFQEPYQRSRRAEGEVMGLLRAGLEGAARTTHIAEIEGESRAIDTALDSLQPGDLCVLLVDQVEQALAHLANRGLEAA